MSNERLPKPIGNSDIETGDRLQCLGMELELSPDQLLSWVLAIGITVLEKRRDVPDAKLYLLGSGEHGHRILMPDETL